MKATRGLRKSTAALSRAGTRSPRGAKSRSRRVSKAHQMPPCVRAHPSKQDPVNCHTQCQPFRQSRQHCRML